MSLFPLPSQDPVGPSLLPLRPVRLWVITPKSKEQQLTSLLSFYSFHLDTQNCRPRTLGIALDDRSSRFLLPSSTSTRLVHRNPVSEGCACPKLPDSYRIRGRSSSILAQRHLGTSELRSSRFLFSTVRAPAETSYLSSQNGDDKSTNCSNPAQLYKAFFLVRPASRRVSLSPPFPLVNCSLTPLLSSPFFQLQSHLLQISPVPPVSSPVPLFPGTPPSPSLTTTFAALSTLAPPNVPAKVDHTHDGEKRNFAALGAVLGLGVVAAVLVVYWAARRKRRWIAAGGEDPDY